MRTDKQGHFVLAGLSARSYVLRAHGSRPRAQILSAPVEAGSRDVELRLPPAEAPTALRGRVVSLAGEAVSDARVALAPIGSRRPGEPSVVGAGVTTGPDGSFLLDAVPSGWIELVVEGDGILPASRLLAPDESRDDVRVLVDPRRRLRFESALAQDPPDELRAVDAQGATLPLWILGSNTPRVAARARLREGRSEELSVNEAARELVIYRRGEELDRVELALLPDELNRIVWP